MTQRNSRLTHELFVGVWTMKRWVERPPEVARPGHLTIERSRNAPDRFDVTLEGQKPYTNLIINEDNQSICCDQRRISISYWRHPDHDLLFGVEQEEVPGNRKMPRRCWTAARETSVQPGSTVDRFTKRTFRVTISSGEHAQPENHYIRIDPLDIESEESGLYSLSWSETREMTNRHIYDIVKYDHRVDSLNSIFGVRSLNLWPFDPEIAEDDRIFATFDNTFNLPTVPTARVGRWQKKTPNALGTVEHRLGALMPHESTHSSLRSLTETLNSILNPESEGDSLKQRLQRIRAEVLEPLRGLTDEEDDPDVGCWVAIPEG